MLNQKENYLRTLHHQIPEYIPKYTFGILPGDPSNPPNCILEPEILADHRWRGGGKTSSLSDCYPLNYQRRAKDVKEYHVGLRLVM